MHRFFPSPPEPVAELQQPSGEQPESSGLKPSGVAPKTEASQTQASQTQASQTQASQIQSPPPSPAQHSEKAAQEPQVPITEAALQELTITTPLWKAKFSNHGAVATSWILTRRKTNSVEPELRAANGGPLELIPQEMLEKLGAPFSLRLPWSPDLASELNRVNFQIEGIEPNQQEINLSEGEQRQITFVYTSPSATARKTFTFYGGQFVVDATADVKSNGADQPVYLTLGPRIGDQTDKQSGSYSTPPQVITYDIEGKRRQFLGAKITPVFAKVTAVDQAGKRIQIEKPLAGDVDQIKLIGADGTTLLGFARVVGREGDGRTITLDSLPEGVNIGSGVAQGIDTVRHQLLWAGIVDHYFGMVAIPPQPVSEAILTDVHMKVPAQEAPRDYPLIAIPVQPEAMTHIFIGPKDRELLAEVGNRYGTDLGALLDYGMLSFMVRPLIPLIGWALDGLAKLFHNYGWAIVAVTILINLALSPLRWFSSKKMKQAAKHQPRLKELQEKMKKLKENPKKSERELQQLQQEQMAIMKEANPLGGCLPMLLQMPIFWAFFVYLTISLDVRHAPWVLWVNDLSTSDPLHILPIVMCVSMIASTQLTPQPNQGDPAMKMQRIMMTWLMPIMLTWFFFWSAPSGLVLYWMVSNLVGVGIQLVINKKTTEPTPPGEVDQPGKQKPGKKGDKNSDDSSKRKASRREVVGSVK